MSRPRIILVVDDDAALRLFWRTTLRLEGFEVQEAGDGLEALRHIDQHPPDVVVLDLDLPNLNGAAVREEIAAQAVTRHIPVVVVTGSTEHDLTYLDVPWVLRKPISADQLVKAVRACLPSGAPGLGA